MQELIDSNIYSQANVYTPERIAWHLLVGEVDESLKGMEILSVDKDIGNAHTFVFEILITIFMELLFNLSKLSHYSTHDKENDKFVPDYTKLQIDALLSVVVDKMMLLNFIARVDTHEKTEIEPSEFKSLAEGRYCRVVLRYHDEDPFFNQNVSDDLYYHMKLNGLLDDKKYKKLENVYSLIILDKIYAVSFTKI